ncbi:MAG: hypothetical protein Kow00107_05330 [Planctomycetota bacterium]
MVFSKKRHPLGMNIGRPNYAPVVFVLFLFLATVCLLASKAEMGMLWAALISLNIATLVLFGFE